jgi:hypothetical protein
VLKAVAEGRAVLCVTTDVALEYEEVVVHHMAEPRPTCSRRSSTARPSVEGERVRYGWQLIPADDRFVDYAIAPGATVETEDRHSDVLEEDGFPPVHVIGVEVLRRLLEGGDGSA